MNTTATRPPANPLEPPPRRAKRVRSRIRWVESLILIAGLLMSARLVQLQVWEGPDLARKAKAQRTRSINLAALRGEIVDRNGTELAVSVEAWSVYAQPADFTRSPEEIAAAIAPLLDQPRKKLVKILSGGHWSWISRQRDDQVAKRIKALKFKGIGVIKESKRVYPKGDLAATLIGFVGIDNKGLAGIEHAFNKMLMGQPRSLDVQVDAMGRELLREAMDDPMTTVLTDGARITLALDEVIQHEAQSQLQQAIKVLEAKGGTVIVMDPKNGDVLAFATLPSYDPNHPEKALPELLSNGAVSGVFEPGSTMKPFTVAAGLEAKAITPRSAFECPAKMVIGDHTIGDHDPPASVRRLTVPEIIQVSSNVGTAQIGMRMNTGVHRGFLEKFGFGAKTGSGLSGESAGLLPKLPWRPINHATISYGQGVSVTALQLATAECLFANGGLKVKPRLILKVAAPDGSTLQDFPPAQPERVLSPESAAAMVLMLQGVTAEGGTGTAARIPGYHIAGKTGTAQKVRSDGRGYSSDVISSFVGFAPAEHPRVVVLTSLDSPKRAHFASQTAAPLFRDVMAATLRTLGVEPNPLAFSTPERSHAAD